MAKKKVDIDKYAAGIFSRTEQYADRVRRHYATVVDELLKLTAGMSPGSSGGFSFGDNKKLQAKADSILRGLYAAVYNEIQTGVEAEWKYANLSCDALIRRIFGKKAMERNHFARWFSRNQEALDAFFKRKNSKHGLNLSTAIWKYTGDLKNEMELALTLCMGEGQSAATTSRRVRQFLQKPDMMFRRFRVKVGEEDILDEDGNVIGKKPIYGRRWKRKVTDPQTGQVTWENFNPRKYHPGKGVYRSSYKNAMRLTRTETNMAYRMGEQDRWMRMDFVLGYRVVMSGNHPDTDICDELSAKYDFKGGKFDESERGIYPKTFVFKGWHPQCRCMCIPILATEEDMEAMEKAALAGEAIPQLSGVIQKPNKAFYDWLDENKDRLEGAENVPYFIRDNDKFVNPKTKSSPLEIANARHASRTADEQNFIQSA